MSTKQIIILVIVAIIAVIAGRLFIRFIGNLVMGGTLFGGNFL